MLIYAIVQYYFNMQKTIIHHAFELVTFRPKTHLVSYLDTYDLPLSLSNEQVGSCFNFKIINILYIIMNKES